MSDYPLSKMMHERESWRVVYIRISHRTTGSDWRGPYFLVAELENTIAQNCRFVFTAYRGSTLSKARSADFNVWLSKSSICQLYHVLRWRLPGTFPQGYLHDRVLDASIVRSEYEN
jgi:hypothetical protein